MPKMRTRAYNTQKSLFDSKLDGFKLKNDYPLMRGEVVANDDPFMLGRVRVRIHCIHGINGYGMKDEDLPWAYPCFFNASYDSGSFIVPEVKNTVWVVFEDGDVNKPVYIGGVYGKGVSSEKAVGNTGDSDVRYQQLGRNEVPLGTGNVKDKIIYRSPKGAMVLVREEKGYESVIIQDQLGQSITLSSPFKIDANISRLDNMDVWDLLNEEASIEVETINGSIVSINSNKDETEMRVSLLGTKNIIMEASTKEGTNVSLVRDESRIVLGDKIEVETKNERAEIGEGEIKLKATKVSIDAEDIYLGGE